MEYISIEEKLLLPVVCEADVVICGGGPGGIGAALFSAGAGAKTVLIEQYGVLGGMAAIAEVTPFMSSYYQGEVLDGPVYGQWKEAMNKCLPPEVCERRQNRPDGYPGRGINKEAAALAAEDLLLEAGVKILYHHQLAGVLMENRKITAARCHTKGGEVLIKGKCFVDSTGDGDLAAMAGCRFTIGNENGECQPMTLCFKLSHVETGWNKDQADARVLGLRSRLNEAYIEAVRRGEVRCPREDVLIFSFELADDNVVHFNTTRVVNCNPVAGMTLSEAEIEARRQLRDIYFWLKKTIPEFRNCRLMSMGVQIGVRESRHVEGLTRITEADFHNCSRFEDAVARCSYSIDIHSPTGSGTVIVKIGDGGFYEIPYGALVAADCDNLLTGGRSISADAAIHSSFRIMPTVISIGQAAGLAAALAAKREILPRDIDGRILRQQLIAAGAPLQGQ